MFKWFGTIFSLGAPDFLIAFNSFLMLRDNSFKARIFSYICRLVCLRLPIAADAIPRIRSAI